ncbi:hypothetical protein BJ322DRAFT_446327 [Thelephora terrestris]|uniref:Uncharacterized protein n=1 Tax=Thelephora terrestris TaxID=56493 RepID=A0A9P6L289_9AGAM|nr:hypothetical protein BJ322DRAFT_446327 [Thelephora terrestris]
MSHPKDEHGGGRGTTSRRHSVSVVQGRRPTIIGFNAPGNDLDEPSHGSFGQSYGRSGLLLTDDDLASDLGSLSLGNDHLNSSLSRGTTSQPSSLPVRTPISHAPGHGPFRVPAAQHEQRGLASRYRITGGQQHSARGI